MNLRLDNSILKWLVLGASVALLAGSVLDALSNSVTWITPKITYIGSVVVLALGLLLLILDKRQILTLSYEDGTRKVDFDWHLLGVIAGLMFILWIPRLASKSGIGFGLNTQEGVIEIPSQKKFEVFYPKKFTSAPHLTFPPEESTEFCRKIFTITEQRADGFKALAGGWAGSAPCLVKWVAEGSIKE